MAFAAAALITTHQNNDLSTGPCPGTTSCLFNIEGAVIINSQSGGMVNLTITNVANYPFTSIVLEGISPGVDGLAGSTPFTYNGASISGSTPLPIGSSSSDSYTFISGARISTDYTVTVTVVMTNGQAITEKSSITSEGQ